MSTDWYPERLVPRVASRITAWRWPLAAVLGLVIVTTMASCGKSPSCFDRCQEQYDRCIQAGGCGNVTCGCYSDKVACASGCYGSSGYALVAPELSEAMTAPPDPLAAGSYGAGLITVP